MANCKICGKPVAAGPAMHASCLEQLVEEVAEQFCDSYCRWPLTSGDLLDSYCGQCPMDKLLRMGK